MVPGVDLLRECVHSPASVFVFFPSFCCIVLEPMCAMFCVMRPMREFGWKSCLIGMFSFPFFLFRLASITHNLVPGHQASVRADPHTPLRRLVLAPPDLWMEFN